MRPQPPRMRRAPRTTGPVRATRPARATRASRGATGAGFTLVEVLVALAVFAIAAVALLAAQGHQARTMAALEARVLAEVVAENRLAEAMAAPAAPRPGTRRGDTVMADRAFAWTVRVSPVAQTGLVRVQVAVTLADSDRPLVDLTGLRRP